MGTEQAIQKVNNCHYASVSTITKNVGGKGAGNLATHPETDNILILRYSFASWDAVMGAPKTKKNRTRGHVTDVTPSGVGIRHRCVEWYGRYTLGWYILRASWLVIGVTRFRG